MTIWTHRIFNRDIILILFFLRFIGFRSCGHRFEFALHSSLGYSAKLVLASTLWKGHLPLNSCLTPLVLLPSLFDTKTNLS
jgi:hypothetical protein